MKYITIVGDQEFTIDIDYDGEITVDGEVIDADIQQMSDTTMYSIIIDGQSHDIRMNEGEGVYLVQLSGELYEVVVKDEHTRRLAGIKDGPAVTSGEAVIKSPMPGVIVDVPVSQGQEVEKGDIVLILESMKMQNEFKAPRAGVIYTIRVAPGDKVEQNAVLMSIM